MPPAILNGIANAGAASLAANERNIAQQKQEDDENVTGAALLSKRVRSVWLGSNGKNTSLLGSG